MSREGHGWFEERLPGIAIEWFTYNAGPAAMEAVLTGSIDATYVGPSPAVNAHLRAKGDDVRVIAGAAYGGAALVVQGDDRIKTAADFRGKRIATPQFGNTQDVAARGWLMAQGFAITQTGGDAQVVPTENPEILLLFQKGELDAAWTVEPWVSRLEMESKGRVFLEEKNAVTTVLASSVALIEKRPDVARKLAEAHRELTRWIVEHPAEAKAKLRAGLEADTHRPISEALIERAWPRLRFDAEIELARIQPSVDLAVKTGFLKPPADVGRLIATP